MHKFGLGHIDWRLMMREHQSDKINVTVSLRIYRFHVDVHFFHARHQSGPIVFPNNAVVTVLVSTLLLSRQPARRASQATKATFSLWLCTAYMLMCLPCFNLLLISANVFCLSLDFRVYPTISIHLSD